jgi:formylglycine-generating enzyme required for sulfatase activity
MLNQIRLTFYIFFIFQVFYIVQTESSVYGFENFSHFKSSGNTCQTSCHQPENLIKIKKNKFESAACKQCHLGKNSTIPISPFKSSLKNKTPKKLELTSNSSRDNTKTTLKQDSRSTKKENSKTNQFALKKMVFVPKGEFIMGSNDRWDDESPEFISETEAFYIDLYETTNQDYKKYVDDTKSEAPYHWVKGQIPKEKENHPVIYVNWFDATNYCKWNGKRLPTEKEWEKAARGENGLIYPWGNNWTLDRSNNPYSGSVGTKPIGSYPNGKSPYGIFDMSGNVWEWVDSFYLPHEGNTIPRPEYGRRNRVLKGGSWFDCLSYGCGLSAPTFNRSFFTPEVRNNSFGFRCAKDSQEIVSHLILNSK